MKVNLVTFGEEYDEDKTGTKRYWLDMDFKVSKQELFEDKKQW